MKSSFMLSGLLLIAAIGLSPTPADACGIKLTAKNPTPRKAVAHSTNPSSILLLGTPPHRLQRELAAAGHSVEIASSASAAKQKSYAVVVVEPAQVEAARSTFAGAIVVVRSNNITADISSVENQVARKPVRGTEPRPAVATSKENRPVLKAGPTPTKQIADAKPVEETRQPEVAPPTPTPKPTPTPTPTPPPKPAPPLKTVAVVPKQVEARPPEPPPKAPVRRATGFGEVYFNVNSSAIDAKHPSIVRVVSSLSADTSIHIVVAGHADPSGSADANMILAKVRAESVRDALVSAGVDSSRIEVVSHGDTRLRYGRLDGRNRRVAIEVK